MSLQRLEPKFSITGEDLVTVMSNSVAVGITGKNLVTVMRDAVAVRLGNDSFVKSLQRLNRSSASPAGPGHVNE